MFVLKFFGVLSVLICYIFAPVSPFTAAESRTKTRVHTPPRTTAIANSSSAGVRSFTFPELRELQTVSNGSNVPRFLSRIPRVETAGVGQDEKRRTKPEEMFVPRNAKTDGLISSKDPSQPFQASSYYGDVYGNAGTPGTSIYMYRPTPGSYYRPPMKPTGPIFSTTTFRPVIPEVTTLGSTSGTVVPIITTPRPISPVVPNPTTTTSPPSTTITFLGTTSPPPTTTAAPSTTTTRIPVIGEEDENLEEEEDEPSKPMFNTEGTNARSRLVGFKKIRNRTTPITSNNIKRHPGAKYAVYNRPGARAMKFDGSDPNVVTDFVFSDIKCYKTKSREYFGASIHMKRGYNVPYIRDRPQDPLTSSNCRMERLDDSSPDVRYRMAATDLQACGVEHCGDSMCLTMVFPRVPTLALADDEVTTIKCLPQKSTMSETQSISFSGDSLENRRSSSTVEGGGQDFAAEVGIFRQNPGSSNGLFARRVNSGGIVQLGEPLQLRSVVRGGDGWSHSKLLDVKVWRMKAGFSQKEVNLNLSDASEVITLVDNKGCRNPEYEVIASSHPLRDPRNNLVHHFTFRAFLFRGQRANEPLIVTAKVQACQDEEECQSNDCGSRLSDPNIKRYKRATELHNASSVIRDYDTQLALHVVGLRDYFATMAEKDNKTTASSSEETETLSFSCTERMTISAIAGACIMLFLCGLGSSLLFYSISNKHAAALKSEGGLGGKSGGSSVVDQGNYIRKRRKPLPPTPTDYDQVPLPAENVSCSDDSLQKSDKSKFSFKHRTNMGGQGGCVYECISETREKPQIKGTPDEGVLIVYCCNSDKQKNGSTSAPSSLSGKKRSTRNKIDRLSPQDADDTEESEESSTNEKHRPRTVRGVKRNNHHKQRTAGIRRRLSSIYREVYSNRHRGSSFPARISTKHDNSPRRGKIYYRDVGNNIYSEDISQSSDSAYCDSVCSKHVEGGICTQKCGALRSNPEPDLFCSNEQGLNRNLERGRQRSSEDFKFIADVDRPRTAEPILRRNADHAISHNAPKRNRDVRFVTEADLSSEGLLKNKLANPRKSDPCVNKEVALLPQPPRAKQILSKVDASADIIIPPENFV